MDYRTLFFTYLASLTVYTAFAVLLALRNRKAEGLAWVAASLVAQLLKYTLQGLEGHIPAVLSALTANLLYLLAFIFQLLGLRWFVTRTPLERRWPLAVIGWLAVLYTVLYVERTPYIANLINIPVLFILAATVLILHRRARGIFHDVAQWTNVFLLGQLTVSTYRAVLTNVRYARPWLVVDGQHDPRWVYSLMLMMFFSTCVILCAFWFFVVEQQRELVQQSRTDALTGALNRRALYSEADRAMAALRSLGRPFVLILLDIDNFKSLNDRYGHAAGDHVLCGLVDCINRLLRSNDLLARTGGEEFAILLPETSAEQGTAAAERLRAAIDSLEIEFDGLPMHISVSIGLREAADKTETFDSVMHSADRAMYMAKRAGKNRAVLARSEAAGTQADAAPPPMRMAASQGQAATL